MFAENIVNLQRKKCFYTLIFKVHFELLLYLYNDYLYLQSYIKSLSAQVPLLKFYTIPIVDKTGL